MKFKMEKGFKDLTKFLEFFYFSLCQSQIFDTHLHQISFTKGNKTVSLHRT